MGKFSLIISIITAIVVLVPTSILSVNVWKKVWPHRGSYSVSSAVRNTIQYNIMADVILLAYALIAAECFAVFVFG